jgi:outer membrane protein, heavy metal efflux system
MLVLRFFLLLPLLILEGLTASPPVQAQSLPSGRASTPSAGSPAMGGASGAVFSQSPSIIGGPPGASVGRTPPRNFNPAPLPLQPPGADEPRVPSPSTTQVEVFPRNKDKTPPTRMEGPSTGITLDEAIERLIHGNLDLRARFLDISQADSDVLTANLRANPIVYSDANGVPYGAYRRAGAPLQYDVNVVYPIDLSHKRQARTRSAAAARMVTEASYRDAVRLTIALLFQAYVDALAAQAIIDDKTLVGKLRAQIDVDEPRSALKQAQRSLALLINVPVAEIATRKLRGQLEFEPDEEPSLTPTENLVRLALDNRPDLQAQRLAVSFTEANIKAVLANRFDDVLLLYQPYTFHDGRQGAGTNNSLAWTIGVTVPLPLYNRQQGNILKARQAAEQARTRLASIEQIVASEVEAAVLEHETAHEALIRTWNDYDKFANPRILMPKPVENIDINSKEQELKKKLIDLEKLVFELQDDRVIDKLKTYWETMIRHRKSMLRLNTVTAVCISQ